MSVFPTALKKLKAYNRLVLADPVLRAFFVAGDHNYLLGQQDALLLELIAGLESKGASGIAAPKHRGIGLLVRLEQLVAVLESMLAYGWLILSRKQLLIFSADRETNKEYRCDFRVTNLYRYLYDRRIAYAEVLHTIFGRGFVGALVRRKRPVMYLDAIDVCYQPLRSLGFARYPELDLSAVDLSAAGDDRKLFAGMLKRYARVANRSRFRVQALARLLRLTSVKAVWGPADTRNYNELMAACTALGIVTYGFQSGNLSKYNVGYLDECAEGRLMRPDFFVAENPYWRSELLRLGTYFADKEVLVGGSVKEDYTPALASASEAPQQEGLTVLVPYENGAPKDEVLEYLRAITKCPSVGSVVFKFRGDRDLAVQAAQYGLGEPMPKLALITNLSEIAHFDIVAGTYSTFLYEMIGKRKPVAMLKSSMDYSEGLVDNRLTDGVALGDALCARLAEIAKTPDSVLEDRRERLYGGAVKLSTFLDTIV